MTTADSFAADLETCYADALRYCRALCAGWSPSEAEDVLHEALLKALGAYDGLRDRARFRPWLFQIVTRTFHSAARRSLWKRFVPLDWSPRPGDRETFPRVYARPEWLEERITLLGALTGLSDRERAALLLFELGGFSLEEIAGIQGARSISAVKSRLSRARAKLKDRLDGPGPAAAPRTGAAAGKDLDDETLHAIHAATA